MKTPMGIKKNVKNEHTYTVREMLTNLHNRFFSFQNSKPRVKLLFRVHAFVSKRRRSPKTGSPFSTVNQIRLFGRAHFMSF